MAHAILLIACPDRKGITAEVTDFVYRRGGNILDADQHTDLDSGMFFMRIKWDLEAFATDSGRFESDFRPLAERFKMSWQIYYSDRIPRVAVFVSRHLHCLSDLWFRYRSGHLPCRFDLIVSNHMDAASLAAQWGVEFLYTPVTPSTKSQVEYRQIQTLKERSIDLVILARYHQILSAEFTAVFSERIINIHHSFLPAFVGGSPYAQAFRKGVKIIGATSHYVIPELDQGPIIEQDTARVSHRHSIEDMIRIGQDLERVVLFRAVRWHLERKVLCSGNKTVVFD